MATRTDSGSPASIRGKSLRRSLATRFFFDRKNTEKWSCFLIKSLNIFSKNVVWFSLENEYIYKDIVIYIIYIYIIYIYHISAYKCTYNFPVYESWKGQFSRITILRTSVFAIPQDALDENQDVQRQIRAHYCWWTKSCTTKDDDYPIIYRNFNHPRWCRIPSINSIA